MKCFHCGADCQNMRGIWRRSKDVRCGGYIENCNRKFNVRAWILSIESSTTHDNLPFRNKKQSVLKSTDTDQKYTTVNAGVYKTWSFILCGVNWNDVCFSLPSVFVRSHGVTPEFRKNSLVLLFRFVGVSSHIFISRGIPLVFFVYFRSAT